MADRTDAGPGGNFRPETLQEAWERGQDERLAELKRQAQRDQYLKTHDPVEYARQEKVKQLRAERQDRDPGIKQAWSKEREGGESKEQNNKWEKLLSEKARAEVEILQRPDPHDRERSGYGR